MERKNDYCWTLMPFREVEDALLNDRDSPHIQEAAGRTATEQIADQLERTKPSRFGRLFDLPLELRHQIYIYLLPCTIASPNKTTSGVVWLRGQTALLRVNRVMHDECMDLLYGSNMFVIWVSYRRVEFLCQWLISSGLTPKKIYAFLTHFDASNIARMRHFIVNVEQPDSYMGMIKYNCSGHGLLAGIREQVQSLVDAIRKVDNGLTSLRVALTADTGIHAEIRRFKVDCVERDKNTMVSQTVLDPLFDLDGVRSVQVHGAIEEEYARRLTDHLTKATT